MFRSFIFIFSLVLLTSGEYYYENNKKIELIRIEDTRKAGITSETRYKNSSGRIFTLKNGIVVKCKNINDFNSVLNKYSIKIKEVIATGYLLLEVDAGNDLFKICRELQNEPSVEIAHPDFKREWRAR